MRPILIALVCAIGVVFVQASSLSAQSDTSAQASEAAVVINQFEQAITSLQQQFGERVFSDRRAELNSQQNGHETIGEAWNRHLVAIGFPKSFSERESIARRLDLSSSSAFILAVGVADEASIKHLINELRRIANK